MKFGQKSVTTKKIIVKPRYEEWRLIIGQLGISVFMDMATFGFGFSVFMSRMCCFLDFVSSTICDFLLFSLWLLVSTKIMADFWTWYCAFLQFWAILLASDISNRPHKKPKSKIHFPRRGDKYPPPWDFPQGCV